MREQQALMAFYEACQATEKGIIVVTLFETQGSTYQKPGARLLVSPAAKHCGLISGGCLEPDIIQKAITAWSNQRITTWQIDTRADSEKWLGYGLGCKGLLWLVFEPIVFTDSQKTTLMRTMLSCDAPFQQIVHAFCPKTETLTRAIRTGTHWSVEPGFPPHKPEDPSSVLTHSILLNEWFFPPSNIVIFAGGDDALPIAVLCNSLGWRYHVICRQASHCELSWPNALSVTTLNRQEPAANVPNTATQYVIVMTHNFECDQIILAALANKGKIPYIGLLGPTHRKEALLTALTEHSSTAVTRLSPRLFAPVGLRTGGRLPSEIALSIVAEIQAVREQAGLIKTTDHASQKPPVPHQQPLKHQQLSVVILAAGASTRLGFPKQLVSFRGNTLLQQAINTANTVATQGVYVVLGANVTDIAATLTGSEIVVFNRRWAQGLATSIQAGFQAAIPNPAQASGHSVLFLLVDQPLVTATHLRNLLIEARSTQADVVASHYPASSHGALGVPAIFASNQTQAINRLSGHAGCKTIIEKTKDCRYVSSDSLDFDIDHPEDVLKLAKLVEAPL